MTDQVDAEAIAAGGDLHALLAKVAWEDGCHRCTAEDIAKPDMAPFMKVKASVAVEAMRRAILLRDQGKG